MPDHPLLEREAVEGTENDPFPVIQTAEPSQPPRSGPTQTLIRSTSSRLMSSRRRS